MVDCHVWRRYQDGLSVSKGVETVLTIIISDTSCSHSSIRHGLNEQENVGLIYGAPAERKGLQHTVNRLLVAAENITGEGLGNDLIFSSNFPRSENVKIGKSGPKISSSMILSDQVTG